MHYKKFISMNSCVLNDRMAPIEYGNREKKTRFRAIVNCVFMDSSDGDDGQAV